MTKSLTIKDLLDAKKAMHEAEKLRLDDLRKLTKSATYAAGPPRHQFDSHTQAAARMWQMEAWPFVDYTVELEMVQHALVSRDRAVIHVPRASAGWGLHTTLERAFEARFGNPAHVNHGFPVNWPDDNCVYVPATLDHLVSLILPRVVEQGMDTHAWPRVVVFAYADDEHFHVEDLP